MRATMAAMSRRVQLVLVAVNVVFWGAILGWTVLADHPWDPPDHLDDLTYAAAAEPICAEAQADLAALGSPIEVETLEERAQLTLDGVDVLEAMLVELRTLPAPVGTGADGAPEAEWVDRWLDDWEVHLGDRRRWAEQLHEGEDVPFTETARNNKQISRTIDNFAEVNAMESCKTTGDV